MEGYIEQAIESVLAQDHPDIEYLVVDGGSTDGTLDILRRHQDRLRFISEPDNGPADAINKGFRMTSGAVFAFLNADDYYLPGAVAAAVRALERRPDAVVVYGEGEWVDEQGKRIGDYPVKPFDAAALARECFLCQPAAFLRRDTFEAAGGMDLRFSHTFDYDLWIRLARHHSMHKIDRRLAATRMHSSSISLGSRRKVFEQTMRLLRHHYGYVPFQLVHSYCSFRMDRRDQFFEPLDPSFSKYLVSLPAGLWQNARHPLRYLREWAGVMSWAGFKRRMKGV